MITTPILAPMFDWAHPVPEVTVQPDLADCGEFRESTRMLLAMARAGRPIYEGTVPVAVVARRRAANKAARKARRAARR
jgi:hypothetical protein